MFILNVKDQRKIQTQTLHVTAPLDFGNFAVADLRGGGAGAEDGPLP